jgi:hypothetical protein
MDFGMGLYMTALEEWRTRYVHKVKITRNDGAFIESGSDIIGCDYIKLTPPSGTKPHTFNMCTVHKNPYSAVCLLIFNCKKDQDIVPPIGLDFSKLLKLKDAHAHFDPIKQYGCDFRRLKGLEITTVTK